MILDIYNRMFSLPTLSKLAILLEMYIDADYNYGFCVV